MIAIPQAANQRPNTRRIAEAGLGIQLEKEAVTVESLRNSVREIMSNSEYRVRAQNMQKDARSAGGFQAAANALQRFVALTI